MHLLRAGRSSAPLMKSSARIGSVAASSPSTCCHRVVSVNKLRKPRHAELRSASTDHHRTFNQHCNGPCCSADSRSDRVAVRGREDLGAFAEPELVFSRELRIRPTRGATRREGLSDSIHSAKTPCDPLHEQRGEIRNFFTSRPLTCLSGPRQP